jgi:hypothetical protein
MPVKKFLPLNDYDEGRMSEEKPSPTPEKPKDRISLWERLVRMGLGESVLKIGGRFSHSFHHNCLGNEPFLRQVSCDRLWFRW